MLIHCLKAKELDMTKTHFMWPWPLMSNSHPLTLYVFQSEPIVSPHIHFCGSGSELLVWQFPNFSVYPFYLPFTWWTHTHHFKDFISGNVQLHKLPMLGILLCFHTLTAINLPIFSYEHLFKISKDQKKNVLYTFVPGLYQVFD